MSSISTKIQLLDFEKPLGELKAKLAFLEAGEDSASPAKQKEIKQVTEEIVKKEKEVYSKLTAWKITQIARHPNRPSTLDFIEHMSQDPIFLHGDRFFRDDPSIVAAITKIDGKPFMVVGHQKGKNTLDNMKRNFGMSHPEGYRKALRLMQLADKFALPILTFIDTPGAFPGIEAEERQQSTAIAQNLQAMGELGVPIISVILGEGGSGGALAIGVANRVLMLENSVYSVISPEGCASILWDDGAKSQLAAEILRLTSHDLYDFGVIEEIIDEPYNCAHNNPIETLSAIKKAVLEHYLNLKDLSPAALMEQRYKRFRRLGVVHKVTPKN